MTNPPPSLVTWFLSLEHPPQAVLLVGIGTVTVAFLAFCATLLSAISAWRSARVAATQAETAASVLFVSLLERRMKWLDRFRAAVSKRQTEIAAIKSPEDGGETVEPTALFEVQDAAHEARVLFNLDVAAIAGDIEKKLAAKTQAIINLRAMKQPTLEDRNRPADLAAEIEDRFQDLRNETAPYLFVGDVKRPPQVVSVRKRIKGWVRWPHTRSTGDRDLSEVRRP
jgi:hypothetical protein